MCMLFDLVHDVNHRSSVKASGDGSPGGWVSRCLTGIRGILFLTLFFFQSCFILLLNSDIWKELCTGRGLE